MVRTYTIANGTVAVRFRDGIDPVSPKGHLPGERQRTSTSARKGIRAVFLDRDGVINANDSYINSPDDFELLPGAGAAIRRLNEAVIPVIVVTNQGAVAFRYIAAATVDEILDKMDRLLAAQDAYVDVVYAAFAHPRGSVPALSFDSPYRKPGIGMLEQARDDLGVDLGKSVVVGDATTDILAGQRAGCRTVLVKTGLAGEDGKVDVVPDAIVADLSSAVDLILAEEGG